MRKELWELLINGGNRELKTRSKTSRSIPKWADSNNEFLFIKR